ncbi:hypothetical protein A2W70_02585 [Candidatus Curtissbacteria bacterium RIFCSPLOWO2_02_41_11]|uniref:Uncharacterized protein n=2 Tax=Candidatus Curtissiibacteriota TaxID=1752717 RepID=A0A1F5HTZ5_9BACT|nr:MAG: hypothetical protein UU56_C0010G0003 [Candidatus Curtissbacteria bacterium GW2011_GWA2_41_24]OGE07648.1 MAG: hypothetical protein A2W70_02585 [Candidatus Curtissbacteria bacterium RIFCSPLOWO2_02_41_11]
MAITASKIYTWVLEISVVVLTSALVWFAFVYYPKVVDQYKSGAVLPTKTIYKPVYAESMQFPIETSAYKIVFESRSNTYYAFINGARLDEFVFNRDNTKLALKSALSVENLCSVKVIYASTQKLEIPDQFQNPGC